MPHHCIDQLVHLLASATGEALLGPATRRGPGLHVTGPDLRGSQRAPVSEPSGIPSASDENEPQRVMGERRRDDARTVACLSAHDDATRGLLTDGVERSMAVGEPVEPSVEPVRVDLDGTHRQRVPVRG